MTMADKIFNQVEAEQEHHSIVQKYKYNYTYTISALVEKGTTAPFILAIEQDADFLMVQMTGSCYGPCLPSSLPNPAGATDFPMPGIAINTGFAGRGLTMAINDTGSSRDLTRGSVPVELMLSPGYDRQFHLPYPFKYFALRNSKIQFLFTNRDTATDARHQIDIAINGFKFTMPERQAQLNPTQQIRQNANVAR